FFQAEDGIRDDLVTGVQTCALPISMRPKDGVQRGSVADMPLYSGDPLTPGVGATKDAKRLDVKDAPTITKIPVLPISYGDAQPRSEERRVGKECRSRRARYE